MSMTAQFTSQLLATDTGGVDFGELRTENGDVFVNVHVKRVESSSLIISHQDGIAQVSLFDLAPSIQEMYQFDPVAAMKADLKRATEHEERLKSLLIETRRREESLEKSRAESELIRLATAEWIPVEATVAGIVNGGLIVRARRITLVPTQIRSTLGFLREGPPKRVLEPFTPELLLLYEAVPTDSSRTLKAGDIWKGYLNPVPDKPPTTLNTLDPRLTVHRGVSRTP